MSRQGNCQIFLFKLSNFPFQTVKIFLFKLSKFSFPNCQNFPFQTVKIFLFKLSKLSNANPQISTTALIKKARKHIKQQNMENINSFSPKKRSINKKKEKVTLHYFAYERFSPRG
jgi:hypothetical protein